MKLLFLIITAFSIARAAVGPDITAAIGPSAIESELTFQTKVTLPPGEQPTDKNIEKLINFHIRFLLSQFDSSWLAKNVGMRKEEGTAVAGLGRLESYKVLSIQKGPLGLEITYEATTEILVNDKILRPEEIKPIQFYLPRDPSQFYVREITDSLWDEQKWIYYYWQPQIKKYQHLFTGKNTVDWVTAQIKGRPSSDPSRAIKMGELKKVIENQGELRISLLLGFDNGPKDIKDEGRKCFAGFKNYLQKNGFVIERFSNRQSAPFAEYVKPATLNSPQIRVSLSLSASDVDMPVNFARRARSAFENDDIVAYLGHSGLDKNLDLVRLAMLSSENPNRPDPIKFKKSYQVAFFDSCCSYKYFSDQFLLAKYKQHPDPMVNRVLSEIGKMEVITYGVSVPWGTHNREAYALLDPFVNFGKSTPNELKLLDVLRTIELRQNKCTYLINSAFIK